MLPGVSPAETLLYTAAVQTRPGRVTSHSAAGNVKRGHKNSAPGLDGYPGRHLRKRVRQWRRAGAGALDRRRIGGKAHPASQAGHRSPLATLRDRILSD